MKTAAGDAVDERAGKQSRTARGIWQLYGPGRLWTNADDWAPACLAITGLKSIRSVWNETMAPRPRAPCETKSKG
jgi:hypothetical protein